MPSERPVSVIRLPPAVLTASAMPKSATSAAPSCSMMFFGLDVAMDHAMAVRVVQRRPDLLAQSDDVFHRQLALPVEPVAKTLALGQRHDVIEESYQPGPNRRAAGYEDAAAPPWS